MASSNGRADRGREQGDRSERHDKAVALAREGIKAAIEHVLIERGVGPGDAHLIAEQMEETVWETWERTQPQMQMTAREVERTVRRVARESAKEMAQRLRAGAEVGRAIMMPEAQIIQQNMLAEIQRMTPAVIDRSRIQYPEQGKGHYNEPVQRKAIIQSQYKSGRPGRIIPDHGRNERNRGGR